MDVWESAPDANHDAVAGSCQVERITEAWVRSQRNRISPQNHLKRQVELSSWTQRHGVQQRIGVQMRES